jgi:hypothetical protein
MQRYRKRLISKFYDNLPSLLPSKQRVGIRVAFSKAAITVKKLEPIAEIVRKKNIKLSSSVQNLSIVPLRRSTLMDFLSHYLDNNVQGMSMKKKWFLSQI